MRTWLSPVIEVVAGLVLADVSLASLFDWWWNAGILTWLGIGLVKLLVLAWLCFRYIPHNRVGIVEKLWSRTGSLAEGRIIALNGEAGLQAELLRGGLHFGLWRWQYRVHTARLVTIPQGEIGYVYARDGEPLSPHQTLGRIVDCQYFQDSRRFLEATSSHAIGQRGRQRAILREGVYAINPALFVVITNNDVFTLRSIQGSHEQETIAQWQKELREVGGFRPVVIGSPVDAVDPLHPEKSHAVDSIGIVTVHDGPSLAAGEIIAPVVGGDPSQPGYHCNFQDPEAFLQAGGRRGRQYQPLTDGTYFINRWFATVETIPKTVVPIGYVGVVVSYVGRQGADLSGTAFRHGERVAEGERGVWERPLGPGKYAFNTYAGNIVMVPTTNFVLHWITGRTETHRYDESLRSIELVTRDAYEPSLPLSVVVHIDYQRAPSVIQRFGDVKRLITQTLDPLLSAYFRDIAHKKTMLELLHDRDTIQGEAREELRRRFREFDIECVDVLIGKPDTAEEGGKIEVLLEQLRIRQLSIEQLETFERQRQASEKLRALNEAQAQAAKQTDLTNAKLQVQIAESQGDADLAKARRQAEQTVLLAQADSEKSILTGRGDAQRILQTGVAEASVLVRKISSYGDPRLYALAAAAGQLSRSTQPLVPERLIVTANGSDGSAAPIQGMLGLLLQLLVAEKTGLNGATPSDDPEFRASAERLTQETLAALQSPSETAVAR